MKKGSDLLRLFCVIQLVAILTIVDIKTSANGASQLNGLLTLNSTARRRLYRNYNSNHRQVKVTKATKLITPSSLQASSANNNTNSTT